MKIKTNDYLSVHMGSHSFLSDEMINDILVNSTFVKDGQTVDSTQAKKRICKIYEPPKQSELAEYISDFIIKKNEEIYNFNIKGIPNFDAPSRFEYQSVDGGKFDLHIDLGPGIYSTRKISYSIQLSDGDEYEGGDLVIFPNDSTDEEKLSFRRKGTIILFPSYRAHCVTPVTKGTRNAIVGWVHGDAFL